MMTFYTLSLPYIPHHFLSRFTGSPKILRPDQCTLYDVLPSALRWSGVRVRVRVRVRLRVRVTLP